MTLVLVLHAHAPYVRPGPEEEPFFEALADTHLPLLGVFRRLAAGGLAVRAALSLSPTYCALIEDEGVRERFRRCARRTPRPGAGFSSSSS